MKRLFVASVVALAAAILASDTANAQQPIGYPFFPFGFYQPYGARYGNSLATPPYFALNPPVYYGARYSRPYGISPFASPPVVSAPDGFEGRLRTNFYEPPRQTPAPICNPCISKSSFVAPTFATAGPVRQNPFFEPFETDKLAKQ